MNKLRKIDIPLTIVFSLLVIIGLIMVYSASNVVALYKYNDEFYFFKRELIFGLVGTFIMILIINMNVSKIYKMTTIIFIIGVALLILVLIPGIGIIRGGARSWIGFGSFSIQPAEFSKIVLVLLLSKYLSQTKEEINSFFNFFGLLGIILIFFGLIMLQPDFGTGIVLVISSLLLLFTSGAPLKYFILIGILGILGIGALIISAPYRLERIFAFLNPWNDPLGSGFQAIQSLYAISPSGLFGLGFNKSMQKHFFLPEPQNDFIFAIICEEFGLIGALILIGLFVFLIYRIIYIGLKQTNRYYRYVCLGVGLIFFTQVFINMGVVIGLLPVTGITLPIISYGGSSLVLSMIMVGLVLNISRYMEE
ncbi:MAG: putative lipid II flippase FtsW [Bacilli bacterium]|nr:putative lipid II flippase FtsW [Bacilli bacterium]MDD7315761.1 putative lipid II flippase FtsW [Bacilli bacterium]MDY4052538.1 putative lipid II flippase FtsW [Bacilli bacterium]